MPHNFDASVINYESNSWYTSKASFRIVLIKKPLIYLNLSTVKYIYMPIFARTTLYLLDTINLYL